MFKIYETITKRNSRGYLVPVVGSLAVYETGTNTLITVYADDEVTTASNPINTDANGLVQGKVVSGIYDFVFYDGVSQSRVNGVVCSDAGIGTTACFCITIEEPADGTYPVGLNMPYGGTISKVTTKALSGTCTLTVKINGTNLGGTANAVSTSEAVQSHSSANTFAAGDDITMVVSSNSSCARMAVTIEYTRT